MKSGMLLAFCIGAILVAASSSANIEILNPLNRTYDISGSSMRVIIDYNITEPAANTWITLSHEVLPVRNDNFIQYFEINESDYNGNYKIRNDIYNRFTYRFTARPTGKGEFHIYMFNNMTVPNASPIDIYYSKAAAAGSWSCLSNNGYRKLADAYDSTEYKFQVQGKHDGQFFTSYEVSINGEKKADCLIPANSITHINKIDVVARDTGVYLSNQSIVAGSYYVMLPAGSYVLRLFSNASGEISLKSVSFSIRQSSDTAYSYCSDGTVEGSCSSAKPKYCYRGSLIDNCNACGCSSGTCKSSGLCEGETTTSSTATTISAITTTTTTAKAASTTSVQQATTTAAAATTTTAAGEGTVQEGGKSSLGKYYIIIAVLLSFFVVIVYLLRRDMEEMKE
jgi:hypothetical protein